MMSINDLYKDVTWCGICREWYPKEKTACPDCAPVNELQTGTIRKKPTDQYGTYEAINGAIANELQEEVDRLNADIISIMGSLDKTGDEKMKYKAEVKKAFWAGFEINHSLGGTDIQAHWNEYEKLRGLGE